MPSYKDITGQRFNRLTAVRDTGRMSGHGKVWEFLCDCGNTHLSKQDHVTSGKTTQCKECSRLSKLTHGMSQSKEYQSWDGAIQRCTNPNATGYTDYGGSGIIFEPMWKASFIEFINHIGMMPNDGRRYTLGRKDNAIGYVAGNVRWETDKQQAHNKKMVKRNSSGVTGVQIWDKGGVDHCVASWYDMQGKQKYRFFSVRKYGFDDAFRMAEVARKEAIEILNSLGAEYSDKHGL